LALLIFTLIVLCVLAGLGCSLGYQLLQQGGRVLLRLESVEERLKGLEALPRALPLAKPPSLAENGAAAPRQTGLPLGSPAPEWELPDLAGTQTALSSFRGRWMLLVFFNPHCGYCTRMVPDLAALPVGGAEGQPLPVVVTTGSRDDNLRLVEEHGLRCPVFLQEEMQVASRYRVGGTPMGYLIDEAGAIASEVAVGAEALLELARQTPEERTAAAARSGENGAESAGDHPAHRGNRTLTESKINRSGLPAGTPAPNFRLPRLGGGELSLEDYQGQEVLLVFSDPHCGPCDYVAPRLEELHRKRPETRILIVSRGEEEENRRKATEHGLSFPIALQKKWEVSRLYEIYGTPVAFLIGEDGRTLADVATGAEPILALLSGTGSSQSGEAGGIPRGEPSRQQP
jgi:peroxiredoxin